MSEYELNELKKGNIENKIFSIPKKFGHIQIENLLATSSEAEEIRGAFKQIFIPFLLFIMESPPLI